MNCSARCDSRASIPIHQGETLYSVLQRAGGLTDVAFPYGAVFIREELKKREKDQLELLGQSNAERFGGSVARSNRHQQRCRRLTEAGAGARRNQRPAVGSQLLAQLRNTKPVGRLVIDVNGVSRVRRAAPDDVLVKDGDKLIVPKKTQEITILGEVQSPTSHVTSPA